MKSDMLQHRSPSLSHTQRGLALPTVLIIMLLLLIISVAYLGQTGEDMRMGGTSRDTSSAQTLAEAGLDHVVERLSSQSIAVSDIDGNTVSDAIEGYKDLTSMPTTLPLGYSFYSVIGSAPAIAPTILQSVATGESLGTICSNTVQKISCGNMSINNLFISGTLHPLLFVQTSSGFTPSANTWGTETEKNKVAVWLEMVQSDPTNNPEFVDVYVQSAAQSEHSKSYVQKFVGTYSRAAALIAPITESANHGYLIAN